MTEIEKMIEINNWFSDNHYLFKLDKYYGIDIVGELYQLVQKCSSDGPVMVSTGDSKGRRENRQDGSR